VARATQPTGSRAERSLSALHGARERLAPHASKLRAIGAVGSIAIVVLVVVDAVSNASFSNLTWWPLLVAVPAAAAWWLGLARGWAVLATGHPTAHDITTWCRTQTLRYLPGGFWAPVSRTTVLEGGWVDRLSTVAAENVIALCAALTIGGVALAIGRSAWWLALIAVIAVPAIGSRALQHRTRLAPDRTRSATLNYLISFLFYAYAAVLVQGAISGPHHLWAVAGAACVAWAVGLVAVFAPGGIGVREAVYAALLSGLLPSGQGAAGAVTMRVVMVCAELAVLVVAGRPKREPGAAAAGLRADLAFVRRHALFGVLFGIGLGLRAIVMLAYQPALVFWDSAGYLAQSNHLTPYALRPFGYPLFLHVLPVHQALWSVPLVQHLMGLGAGLMIYLLLQRLTIPRWAAALAAAPVLLDGFQLDLEQYVLSETLFNFLLLSACVVLLWRRRPTVWHAAGAGVLLSMVALTRANGLAAIPVALLTLLCLRWDSVRGSAPMRWLRSARPAIPALATMLVFLLVPLGAYAVWFHHVNGPSSPYGLTDWGGRFLYARVAPFADCTKFTPPASERHLCPIDPPGHRPRVYGSSVEYYMWGRNNSPLWTLPVSEEQRRQLAGDFAKRVIKAQPVTYAKTVLHDFLRPFYPVPARRDGELPVFRWQFQSYFPLFFANETGYYETYYHETPHLNKGLARFLKGYRSIVYTSGIVLAVGLLAGLLAALGLGRARRSGLRCASLLFAGMAVSVFGSTVLANQFSYRYYVTLLTVLPPAAAIGLTALIRRPQPVGEVAGDDHRRTREPVPVRLAPQPGDARSIPQANPG
jgi:hypothetical protein